jgi:hypothetical protein
VCVAYEWHRSRVQWEMQLGDANIICMCVYVCVYVDQYSLHQLYTALHSTALHCTVMQCTALHCTASLLYCQYSPISNLTYSPCCTYMHKSSLHHPFLSFTLSRARTHTHSTHSSCSRWRETLSHLCSCRSAHYRCPYLIALLPPSFLTPLLHALLSFIFPFPFPSTVLPPSQVLA